MTESGKKAVVVSANKPESAFLGPKIWKNPITLPILSGNNGSGDAEFSIMNIDDFLNENNFDINRYAITGSVFGHLRSYFHKGNLRLSG